MVRGDKELIAHVKSAADNATYLSAPIQNEIIQIGAKVVLQCLKDKIENHKYYSVLLDEGTDVSLHSQLSVSVRFCNGGDIEERFVGFIRLTDRTSNGIFIAAVTVLEEAGLSLDSCVGIAVDGAAVMSGIRKSVRTLFRTRCPWLIYHYCFMHSIGRGLVLACESVANITHAIRTVTSVCSWFRVSSKRHDLLMSVLKLFKKKHTTMKSEAQTRFVENNVLFDDFCENLTPILTAMVTLSNDSDKDTAAAAKGYILELIEDETLITIVCMQTVCAVMAQISSSIQQIAMDFDKAKLTISSTITLFDTWISGEGNGCASKILKKVHTLASEIADLLGRPLRRKLRFEPERTEIEESDVENCLHPFLRQLSAEMKDRLQTSERRLEQLSLLLPSNVLQAPRDEINSVVEFYLNHNLIEGSLIAFDLHFELYLSMVRVKGPEKVTAKELWSTFFTGQESMVAQLLKIYYSIPSTTASAERSFSNMRVIKSYLRNSMSDERLSALTVLYANPLSHGFVNRVCEEFWKSRPRRNQQ